MDNGGALTAPASSPFLSGSALPLTSDSHFLGLEMERFFSPTMWTEGLILAFIYSNLGHLNQSLRLGEVISYKRIPIPLVDMEGGGRRSKFTLKWGVWWRCDGGVLLATNCCMVWEPESWSESIYLGICLHLGLFKADPEEPWVQVEERRTMWRVLVSIGSVRASGTWTCWVSENQRRTYFSNLTGVWCLCSLDPILIGWETFWGILLLSPSSLTGLWTQHVLVAKGWPQAAINNVDISWQQESSRVGWGDVAGTLLACASGSFLFFCCPGF